MQELVERWKATADARAIFLHCYLLMTRNMLDAIEAGQFHDARWTHALLERFADYYFDALDAYEQKGYAPAVWQLAYDATRRPQTAVLQHLLLGVNAHINYDLVLALVDMLHAEWRTLTDLQRRQRYDDHCRVNAVIANVIDAVQDGVLVPLTPALGVVDRLLGPLDEWMTARLIARWRDEVWRHAAALMETAVPAEQERLRRQVETLTLRRADAILQGANPQALTRLL